MKKVRITLLDNSYGNGNRSLVFSWFPSCAVIGVDYNPLRLARARSIVKNAKFIVADLRNKNDKFPKFDVVFSSQIIEHIEDDVSFDF